MRVGAGFEHLFLGEPFRPQPLAGLPTDRVVVLRNHRQANVPPLEAEGLIALLHAAEQIQFVKARHDQDALGTGLEARNEVALVPFPSFLLHKQPLRVFPPGKRIFDKSQISSFTSHGDADTHGPIAAASRQSPVRHRLGRGIKLQAKHAAVRLNKISNLAADLALGKFLCVRARQDQLVRIARKIPRREEMRDVCSFCRTRRGRLTARRSNSPRSNASSS